MQHSRLITDSQLKLLQMSYRALGCSSSHFGRFPAESRSICRVPLKGTILGKRVGQIHAHSDMWWTTLRSCFVIIPWLGTTVLSRSLCTL